MVGDIKSIENLPLRTLVCFIGLLDTLSVMMFFATCVQIYFFHLKLAMENGATLETILRWSKPQEEYALNHETQRLIVTTSNQSIYYNLRYILGGTIGSLFFWFPTWSNDKYDGYYYPQVGAPKEILKCNMAEQKTVVIKNLQ